MHNQGFTLLELLVVIAIIGILSSIAVISLTTTRESAKAVVVLKELNSARAIIQLCMFEGRELYFDFDKQAELNQEFIEGGSYSDTWEVEICTNAGEYWPLFIEYGWLYQDVGSDAADNQWALIVSNGDRQIECSYNTGCVKS